MIIKQFFKEENKKDITGVWREISKIYISFISSSHDITSEGHFVERIKVESLPRMIFLNCVYTICETIGYEFGAEEVDKIYSDLDPAKYVELEPIYPSQPTFHYCCRTMYERTIIFGAVYYVLSKTQPELQQVIDAVYRQAYYKEGAYYFDKFKDALSNTTDSETNKVVNTDLDGEICRFIEGYRDLSPRQKIFKCETILRALRSINEGDKSQREVILQATVEEVLILLRRQYQIWDTVSIDYTEHEKIALQDIIATIKNYFPDNSEFLTKFVEFLVKTTNDTPKANAILHKLLQHNTQSSPLVNNVTINVSGDYNDIHDNQKFTVKHG